MKFQELARLSPLPEGLDKTLTTRSIARLAGIIFGQRFRATSSEVDFSVRGCYYLVNARIKQVQVAMLPPDVMAVITSAAGTFVAQLLIALGKGLNQSAFGPELEQRLTVCYQVAVGRLVEHKRLEGWSEPRLEALAHVFGLPEVAWEVARIVGGETAPEETELGKYFGVGVVREGEDSAPNEEILQFIRVVIKGGFVPDLYQLLVQTIKDPDLQVTEIMTRQRYDMLTSTLESMKQDLLQAIARPTPSSFPKAYGLRRKAYDENPSAKMLRRERLSKEDMETGRAIKPRGVEEIVRELLGSKNVAVQGKPGSGKSAFAAWVDWILEKNDKFLWAFHGRELQTDNADAVCRELEQVPPEFVLLIDDIHLVNDVIERLGSLSWSSDRIFLLCGRIPYVEEAIQKKGIPKIQKLFTIKESDSSKVAEDLAIKLLGKSKASQVLKNTERDLVLTKWLLEAIVLDNKPLDYTPTKAAVDKLEKISEEWGNEELRLYITLVVFRSLELSSSERLLSEGFGFGINTIKGFHKKRLEAERGLNLELDGSYPITLNRHPKLCKVFIEAAPLLGQTFREFVLEPTCKALGIADSKDISLGFYSLVMGTALKKYVIDIYDIEERLLQIGKRDEYINIIKIAISLLKAADINHSSIDLPIEDKIFRLELAFGEYNGERRLKGGEAARKILEETKRKLDVTEIPSGLYKQKGYFLYQDAYILRLGNSGQPALDRYIESAEAEEEWGKLNNLPLHYGKAIQSDSAAATYRIDLAVFSDDKPGQLNLDLAKLTAIAKDLKLGLEHLHQLLIDTQKEKERRELERYRNNALLILAEASGWLGDNSTVEMCLNEIEKVTDLDEWRQLLAILAKGTLAFAQKQYRKVIAELYGKHKECLRVKGGENAGKIAVMLLISYQEIGDEENADALRLWLLSDDCLEDSGNGLAKMWAARL